MKTMIKQLNNMTGLVGVALMSLACGAASTTAITPVSGPLAGELVDANGKPAPVWVTQPSKYKMDDGKKALCGEGSAGGTRSISMAQTAAAGRARTSLARNLDTKVSAILKDYQATTTGGEAFGKAANDEQHIQDASKQVTQTTLTGTEVNETWVSSSGTLHTLVCMDLDKFKGAVSGMEQLNEGMRKAIVQRAEKAFDEIEQLDPKP